MEDLSERDDSTDEGSEFIDVKDSDFELPDEDEMSCEDGLVENHYYRDLRGFEWDDYEEICDAEQELLDYEDDGGDLLSDEAVELFEDNMCFQLDLDPGVASTVIALAAMGACPVTSCKGGEGHYESHPLVFFWADIKHKDMIVSAAKKAKVFLKGTSRGLLVYHETDVRPLMSFAENLFDICYE